jgi:HEAT repeat protein
MLPRGARSGGRIPGNTRSFDLFDGLPNRRYGGCVTLASAVNSANSSNEPTRRDIALAGHAGNAVNARKGLTSSDPKVRSGAFIALVRIGNLDVEGLLGGLNDHDPDVVRRCTELAAHNALESGEVDDCLLRILTGTDSVSAEIAAWAMGERHEEAGPTPHLTQIVSTLSIIVGSHSDALVREAAVAALGSIGSPAGLEAVLAATTDKVTVRRRAVIALAAFEGEEVEEALSKARTDRDWQVRQAAEDLGNAP